MLELYDINHNKIAPLVNYRDLKIERDLTGDEVLSFSYPFAEAENIKEECYIRTQSQEFVIKEIIDSEEWITVTAKVNLESIKGKSIESFEVVNSTVTDAVNLALAGTGWALAYTDITKRRTVKKANCGAYDVLEEIRKVTRAEFKFNAIDKKIYAYSSAGQDKGMYFTDELNLRKLTLQSNSYDFCTRLIPIGKDGLSITGVNGGVKYVENYQYSSKVITVIWEDNRYTDAQSLKDDAILKLDELSKPIKAYAADVMDLAKSNEKYKDILDYDLGDTITLLSRDKRIKEKQRIVKIVEYPDEPERNTCEIANRTLRFEDLQSDVLDAADTVDSITTSDGMVDDSKVNFDPIRQEFGQVIAEKANITDLQAAEARIGSLETTRATITQLEAVQANIETLIVDTARIQDAAITTAKIGNAQITSALIADAAITTAKIGSLAVGSANIQDAAITTAKIGDAQITNAKIASLDAGKITTGTLSAGRVTIGASTTFESGYNPSLALSQMSNPYFEQGKGLWSTATNGKTGADTTLSSITTVAGQGSMGNNVLQVVGDRYLWYSNAIPIDVNKKYKLRFRVRQTVNPTVAGKGIIYAGVSCLDDNYNHIQAPYTWHNYSLVAGYNLTVADGWKEYEVTMTGDGGTTSDYTKFKTGTKYIKPMFIVNYSGGDGTAQVDFLTFEEFTEAAELTSLWRYPNTTLIDGGDIYTGTITANKMAVGTITAVSGVIADAAITSAKIGDAQITTAKIATGAITTALIAQGAIGSAQISDASITDAKIVGLTASKLTAGIIDASIINVTNLRADNIVTGTLTFASANLLRDTQFKQGSSHWDYSAGVTVDTAAKFEGENTVKNIQTGLASNSWRGVSTKDTTAARIPVVAGEVYTYTIYAMTDDRSTVDFGCSQEFYFYGASGNFLSLNSKSILPTTNNQWERFSLTITVPANATSMWTRAWLARNGRLWVAKPMVQKGSLGSVWQPHTNELLAEKGITNFYIGDSAVDNRVITANTITGDKIVADTITAREIAASTITANEMVAGTITAGSGIIADAAITSAKIADGTIVNADIANATIQGAKIVNATITTALIGDGQITTAKIGAAQITSALIEDAAITNAKIQDGQITTAKIGDAQITSAKIVSLDATKITAGTMSAARISGGTLTLGGVSGGVLSILNSEGLEIVRGDSSGFVVDGGSYKLKDGVVIYDLLPKSNLLNDHSFEMLATGGSIDTTFLDFAVVATSGNSFQWNKIGTPRLYSSFQTGEYSPATFGLQAAICDASHHFEQYIPVKPNTTYTFSGYALPARRAGIVSCTARLYLQQLTDEWTNITSGTQSLAIGSYTTSKKPLRISYTITTAANCFFLRAIPYSAAAGQWVAWDGMQLVEGNMPSTYEPENSIWAFMRGWYASRMNTVESATVANLGQMEHLNGYWGLASPTGATGTWFRTGTAGLIPYAQGGGSSSLGTSTWPFNNIYAENIYRAGNKVLDNGRYAQGSTTLDTVANGSSMKSISFGKTLTNPRVMVNLHTTVPHIRTATATNISATGFDLYLGNNNASIVTSTITWVAIGD